MIVERANALEDDGHVPKMIRALAYGAMVCKAYGKGDRAPIG
jgi:hypothetical protein